LNDLEKLFYEGKHRITARYPHYFEIYDKHFSKFRNLDMCMVELGIGYGGCLQIWKNYFGPKAKIYGADNALQSFPEDQIELIYCRADQRESMAELRQKLPPIDILLDDCSHISSHQIIAFEELFPHLKDYGIYMVEDVYTSYAEPYEGGYKKEGSFIEYIKNLIDLNNLGTEMPITSFIQYFKQIRGVYFYSGIVVIEKGPRNVCDPVRTGNNGL